MKKLLNKYFSKLVIVLLFILCGWYGKNLDTWGKDSVIVHDVISYYAYLPAAIIFHDLDFKFINDHRAGLEGKIWYNNSSIGKPVLRMTLGLAILWLPFFLLGHGLAHFLGVSAFGYSWPYSLSIFIATLFYLVIGLIFLRKILLKYFPDWITAITLILIVTATNLMYYVISEPGMSHVYSFAMVTIFLFSTLKWINKPTIFLSIILGLLAGLIVLIRPVNGLVLIFPALIGINSFSGIKDRVVNNWKFIVIAAISCFLMILPQIIYWKMQTGQFLFNSYQESNKFYFLHPHVVDGLFSFRNGWLIYSPVMFFALTGFFFIEKYAKGLRNAMIAFLLIFTYFIFSWWCWWYGGSYGSRPMVETYGILALPLAASFTYLLKKKIWVKIVVGVVLAALLSLNQFQMQQRRTSLLHWDSMTKEAYFGIFLRQHVPAGYDKMIKKPDYKKALKGEEEYFGSRQSKLAELMKAPRDTNRSIYQQFYFNDFESELSAEQKKQVTSNYFYSGKQSILLCPDNIFSPAAEDHLKYLPDTCRISLRASVRILNPSPIERGQILLVVSINDTVNKAYKYNIVKDTETNYKPGEWFELSRTDVIDRNIPVNGTYKIYVWYTGKNKIYVDDLKLEYMPVGYE